MQLEGCGSVEMGATWLHGLAGNPLFDLAVQEGLMTRTAKPAGGVTCCIDATKPVLPTSACIFNLPSKPCTDNTVQ